MINDARQKRHPVSPIFIGATMGVLLEVIATLVDEIVVGNLFSDEAFRQITV